MSEPQKCPLLALGVEVDGDVNRPCIALDGVRGKGRVGLCQRCTEDPADLLRRLIVALEARQA
jgi:hypothetical protein